MYQNRWGTDDFSEEYQDTGHHNVGPLQQVLNETQLRERQFALQQQTAMRLSAANSGHAQMQQQYPHPYPRSLTPDSRPRSVYTEHGVHTYPASAPAEVRAWESNSATGHVRPPAFAAPAPAPSGPYVGRQRGYTHQQQLPPPPGAGQFNHHNAPAPYYNHNGLPLTVQQGHHPAAVSPQFRQPVPGAPPAPFNPAHAPIPDLELIPEAQQKPAKPSTTTGRGRGGARGGQDAGRGGQPGATGTGARSGRGGSKATRGGKGSKSGAANRRDGGASDDEIREILTPEQIKELREAYPEDEEQREDKEDLGSRQRGLSDEEKQKMVEHITDSEKWERFRLDKDDTMNEIASVILKNRVSVSQVKSAWEYVWKVYKICRERDRHTGGRDGDSDKFRGYLNTTLDEFQKSTIYKRIDEVAHDDDSVIRTKVFDSEKDISDSDKSSEADVDSAQEEFEKSKRKRRGGDDGGKKKKKKRKSAGKGEASDSDDFDRVAADTLRGIQKKNDRYLKDRKKEEQRREEELKLARNRDKREQADFEHRTETSELDTIHKQMDSPFPRIRALGEARMNAYIAQQEALLKSTGPGSSGDKANTE